MLSLLRSNNRLICPRDSDLQTDTECMRDILMKLKGKEYNKIMVTFKSVPGELDLLKDTQIFDLSFSPNDSRGNFDMNLSQILKTISGQEELPMDWYKNDTLRHLQEMISMIPVAELVDSDDMTGFNPMNMFGCLKNCPIPISEKCQNACRDCIERHRFGFTESNVDKCRYSFSDEGFGSKEIPHNVYSNEGHCACISHGTGGWEPEAPDSDTESDSLSVLVQKSKEINRNYMTTLNEEQREGEQL